MFDGVILVAMAYAGIFFLIPTILASAAITAPINDLARLRKGTVRIALIDVCCLIALVQLSLSPLALGNFDRKFLLLVALVLASLLIVGWWRGIVKLSRIGVMQSPRRAALLLYVVPVTQLWVFVFFALWVAAVPALQHAVTQGVEYLIIRAMLLVGGPAVATVVALWIAYRVCCWIARGAKVDQQPNRVAVSETSGGPNPRQET